MNAERPQRISKYANPAYFETVSLATIATEIGRTPRQTRKLMKKLGFIGLVSSHRIAPGRSISVTKYDAMAIEAVKALMKQPHRMTSASADDWLSDYINNGGKQ